jgi:hypothetical protein
VECLFACKNMNIVEKLTAAKRLPERDDAVSVYSWA